MDALTQVLGALQLKPTVFHHLQLVAPWGLSLSAQDGAAFHVVQQGRCWLRINDLEQPTLLELHQGDIIVLSNLRSYELLADPASQSLPLHQLLQNRTDNGRISLSLSSQGEMVDLLCSYFKPELEVASPLFSVVPSLIFIPGQEQQPIEWLAAPLHLIGFEVQHNYPGKDTVISRVMDILFIMVIRYWIAHHTPSNGGWLNALYHPQLGKVLGCMHRQPEQSWTVDSLAKTVNMSRSSLANQFTVMVGEAPMKYLTRWRMQLAARWLLQDTSASLESIALRVGYSSSYAFSKAFKRIIGTSPGSYRQPIKTEF